MLLVDKGKQLLLLHLKIHTTFKKNKKKYMNWTPSSSQYHPLAHQSCLTDI